MTELHVDPRNRQGSPAAAELDRRLKSDEPLPNIVAWWRTTQAEWIEPNLAAWRVINTHSDLIMDLTENEKGVYSPMDAWCSPTVGNGTARRNG
jgi:hypothetical protein